MSQEKTSDVENLFKANTPAAPASRPLPQSSDLTKPVPSSPVTAPNNAPSAVKKLDTIATLVERVDIKRKFEAMLGKKAPGFMSSLISLTNSNALLKNADPRSIVAAAAIAATLDLPINPNLGFAYIVPYRSEGKAVAQFQMGWKGFVQLAIRTGLYKTMNATEIYEGELISYNRLSGETVIDEAHRTSDKIVGYIAYFRLSTGFEKTLYMTVEQVRKHAARYSKSFSKPTGPWKTHEPEMSLKTLMKLLLSKWGILSVEMQKAVNVDQGVIHDMDGEKVSFPDNPDDAIEASTIPDDDQTAAPAQNVTMGDVLDGNKK